MSWNEQQWPQEVLHEYWPSVYSFQRAIVKTVDSFDTKEKVIEEIEGFPELMESTEIREMVERAKKLKAEEES